MGQTDFMTKRRRGPQVGPQVVRLICLDVDGTLIGSSGTVAEEVWSAAAELRRRGVRLAISSGRPGFGVTRELATRLDADGWHCFQNGASVLHLGNGGSRSAAIPVDVVRALIARARATGRVLELYTDTGYAVERDTPRARAHAELLGLGFEARPFEELRDAVVRAQWLLSHHELEDVLAESHEGLEISPSTAPTMPDTRFVNLTTAGVTKATATRAVAEAYGVALSDVMFVGDGWNDAAAMSIVGWSVAMGNAEPQALAAAHHVTGHVDEGGLADVLRMVLRAQR